jgi:hypothetical protein
MAAFGRTSLAVGHMRWTLRKLDALLGTILAAAIGLGAAQLPAFIQQYLQRLGGHADEARLNLSQITAGTGFRSLDTPARELLSHSLAARVNELELGIRTIRGAAPSAQPFVFVRELDPEIALATLRSFEPAVPLSTAGLVYGIAGMVAGWLLYELIKAPAGLAKRRQRRRRYSRRPLPIANRIEPT